MDFGCSLVWGLHVRKYKKKKKLVITRQYLVIGKCEGFISRCEAVEALTLEKFQLPLHAGKCS